MVVRCTTRVSRPPRAPRRTACSKSAARRMRCAADSTDLRQAESSERPLRRRAARIARPARVRIRRRKPWVLARRRLFGWKVRLLTRVSNYIGWVSHAARPGSGCRDDAPRTRIACVRRQGAPAGAIDKAAIPYVPPCWQVKCARLADPILPHPGATSPSGALPVPGACQYDRSSSPRVARPVDHDVVDGRRARRHHDGDDASERRPHRVREFRTTARPSAHRCGQLCGQPRAMRDSTTRANE